MPQQVHEALVEIIAQQGHFSLNDAEGYFKQLQREKRFQQECWY